MRKLKPKLPECPAWLDSDARTEWARVLSGCLIDGRAEQYTILAGYCQHFSRWKAAEQVLTAEGTEVILRDDKGNVKSVGPSPHIGIANKSFDRMLKAAATLGFTVDGRRTGQGASVAMAVESEDKDWFGDSLQ